MNATKIKSASYFIRGGTARRNGNTVVVDESDPFREDFRTDDPTLFEDAAKARGFKSLTIRPRISASKAVSRMAGMKAEGRTFAPQLAEVGSFVTFAHRGAMVTGQVWAQGKPAGYVWVADGEKFHEVHESHLRPAGTENATISVKLNGSYSRDLVPLRTVGCWHIVRDNHRGTDFRVVVERGGATATARARMNKRAASDLLALVEETIGRAGMGVNWELLPSELRNSVTAALEERVAA